MEFILILLFAASFVLWAVFAYRCVVKNKSMNPMLVANMFMLLIILILNLYRR